MSAPQRRRRTSEFHETFSEMANRDSSHQNIVNISKGASFENDTITSDQANIAVLDDEVQNLLRWLAKEQGVSLGVALKKAVATAAYIQDVTVERGGKLLVKHPDNSIREIIINK